MKNKRPITSFRSHLGYFLSFIMLLSFITIPIHSAFGHPPPCETDMDCPQGQVCSQGFCDTCKTDMECPLGLVCNQGNCKFAYCLRENNGADCPNAGNACISISCKKLNPEDDAGNSMCFEEHIEGAACAFDRDCGTDWVCNTTTCQCEPLHPPVDPPANLCAGVDCDDHDACTSDSCDKGSGTCSHLKIANCPAPTPPETPKAEATPPENTVNPCLTTFSAQGVEEELANSLAAQGICSLSLTGQSARACSLEEGAGSPWPMIVPLLGGIVLICSRKSRGKKLSS